MCILYIKYEALDSTQNDVGPHCCMSLLCSNIGDGHGTNISFQVCSDVHLEEQPGRTFEHTICPRAPYLILAGDIGDPISLAFSEFIHKCCDNFKHVYFVPGNHEYHGHGIIKGNAIMEALFSKLPNVSFLQCSKSSLGPYVILGATLWTHIPPQVHQAAIQNVGDYSRMTNFSPSTCTTLNRQHVNWLSDAIHAETLNGNKLIIITHHPPSMHGTSHGMFRSDPLRFCYRNNLDHLISLPTNVAWICGHTHYSFMQRRGKTYLLSNQTNSKTYIKGRIYHINTATNELSWEE